MMNDIFNNITAIVIMYAPTVLLALTQLVDWFVTLKQFKALNIHAQVAPLLNKCNNVLDEVKELKKTVEQFHNDKMDLAAQVINLTSELHEQCVLNMEMKEFLKKLSQENIELKATLRRKVSCGATELEPV